MAKGYDQHKEQKKQAKLSIKEKRRQKKEKNRMY